jgi:4-amino-4-deoxychorismate lyase
MTACVLLNGKPAAGLPFADRGLAYGDGLFETIKVIAGSPQFLQQHLQRLQRDCQRLAITLDCDTLRAEIALLLAQHHTGI